MRLASFEYTRTSGQSPDCGGLGEDRRAGALCRGRERESEREREKERERERERRERREKKKLTTHLTYLTYLTVCVLVFFYLLG